MKKQKFKKIIRALFVFFGLSIAFYLAHKIGFDSIINNLRVLGWKILPLLCLPAIWYFLYTVGWYQFLKRLKGMINIYELFSAKIAGELVNTMTPASFLGGDPVRIYLLKKHFPVTEGAASVVVDRTLHTMAVLLVIYIGIVAAFWRFDFLPLNMKYGLPIILMISSVFMGFVFAHQRRGLFSFLMYLLKGLRLKKNFSTKTIERFQELDYFIADFYLKSPKGFWFALFLHFLGRLLGVVEIYAVGKIFFADFTLYAALLLCALAPLINFIFAFIPGALGIMEGAYSGVLYLLNMPPNVGISIQIYRRIRALFWMLIAFIILGTKGRKTLLNQDVIENVITQS